MATQRINFEGIITSERETYNEKINETNKNIELIQEQTTKKVKKEKITDQMEHEEKIQALQKKQNNRLEILERQNQDREREKNKENFKKK